MLKEKLDGKKKNDFFNIKYKKLIKDIFTFAVGTVLAKIIQFILMPLYTSYLSSETYGMAELTNNLSELLIPIATLCIYEAAFRFAVDLNYDRKELATNILKLLIYSMGIGIVIAIIIRILFHYQFAFYLYAILYAYSIKTTFSYYVRGKGLTRVFAMSGIINALALGVFDVIFLVLLHTKSEGYLLAIFFAYLVTTIYLWFRGKISKDTNFKLRSNKKLKRSLIEYSYPLIFYNILYWFITISGRYILLWKSDNSTVGIYVAAIKIAAVINMIQQAVYAAYQLNSSEIYTEENREKYYSNVINFLSNFYFVTGSIVICFSPVLATLTLKNEFYEGYVYLPIIMLSAVLNCVSSLFGTMYSTYKMTNRTVPVSIIGAGVNLVTGISLVTQYKIWGICMASCMCYLIQVIYKMYDIKRVCNVDIKTKRVIINIALISTQVLLIQKINTYKYLISSLIVIIFVVLNGINHKKHIIDFIAYLKSDGGKRYE